MIVESQIYIVSLCSVTVILERKREKERKEEKENYVAVVLAPRLFRKTRPQSG